MTTRYFARACRAAPSDLSVRIPQLAPLAGHTAALFGLGALGAPLAIELARCGIGELRILDQDFVEPATVVRWPLGLPAAGLAKAEALANFIGSHYPFTTVKALSYSIGAAPADDPGEDPLEEMVEGASILIDATAEVGIQHFLSDMAAAKGLPFLLLDASYGAWGGTICRVRPGITAGCWMCFRHAIMEGTIPDAPADPNGEVQPVGCADPTFTGASFDLGMISLQAARLVVSTLCSQASGGYPAIDADVIVAALHTGGEPLAAPAFTAFPLNAHPECKRCNP